MDKKIIRRLALPFSNGNMPRTLLGIRGSIWTIGGYGTAQLLRLVSNVVLARLLFPEAFSLMALVMVFMQGLQMFSDIGILPSIIQNKRGDDPAFLNTAWTIQAIRGFVLWGIACLCAYPFSLAYKQPNLAILIPVAGLSAVLAGLNSTALASANRHLRLGKITLIEVISQGITILVMITWAMLSPTIWALVVGGLAGSLGKLILSHTWLEGIRNKILWDKEAARSLIRFGKWIFVSTLFLFLANQSDKFIFGQLVSMEQLGVYTIAVTLASVPFTAISQLSSRILFLSFCRSFNEHGQLGENKYRSATSMYLIAGILIAFVTFTGGPVVVDILYDHRYQQAAILLQLIVIGKWFEIILGSVRGASLLAYGKAHWNGIGSALKFAVICLTVIPIFKMYGFNAAVLMYAVSECVRYALFVYANYKLGIRYIGNEIKATCLFFALIIAIEKTTSHFVSRGFTEINIRLLLCFIFTSIFLIIIYSVIKNKYCGVKDD